MMADEVTRLAALAALQRVFEAHPMRVREQAEAIATALTWRNADRATILLHGDTTIEVGPR